jgi:hypothetical protein
MLKENTSPENESTTNKSGGVPVIRPVIEVKPTSFKTPNDATLPELIRSSHRINTPEQFCEWMAGDFQHFFPHGMMASGIGDIENLGSRVHKLITWNYPEPLIQALQQENGLISSPIIARWIKL